jgi:hypothetical protein
VNGNNILLDTNAALYLLGGRIKAESLPSGEYFVSFDSYPLLNETSAEPDYCGLKMRFE